MGTILDERDDRDANGSSVDTLYVRYDGEALRTHEMDVKQLAPALLSLAKAFDTLQKDVAPGARVQLNAKATREGSFAIDLLIHLANEAESILAGDPVTAIVNASGLMGIYFGAVGMLKKLARNVKPVKTEAAGKNDDGLDLINVTFSDGSRMCALRASVDALKNPELVKSIKAPSRPRWTTESTLCNSSPAHETKPSTRRTPTRSPIMTQENGTGPRTPWRSSSRRWMCRSAKTANGGSPTASRRNSSHWMTKPSRNECLTAMRPCAPTTYTESKCAWKRQSTNTTDWRQDTYP